MASALNAVVTRRLDLAPGLALFRVAPEGWEVGEFEPGQFAVLGLPGGAPRHPVADPEDPPAPADRLIKRAYSVASPSSRRTDLEFYVSLVRSGALTPRLFALRRGDPIWLGPKITGLFTLAAVPRDLNLVLIATGTGMAPYMSMLRSRLLETRSGRVAVLHGARRSRDLGYRAELESLERDHARFAYLPSITRPDEEATRWTGETGRLQEIWRRDPLRRPWGFPASPEHTHVLLCGNPGMIDAMSAILVGQGFREHRARSPGEIHVERYW